MAKQEKKLGFEVLKGTGKKFSIGERIVQLSPKMSIEDAKLIGEQYPEYVKLKQEPVNPTLPDDTQGNPA